MNSLVIQRCLYSTVIVGALATSTALMLGQPPMWALSLAVGFAVAAFNLWALRVVVSRFVTAMASDDAAAGGRVAGLLMAKGVGLIAVIFFALRVLSLNTMAFGMGVGGTAFVLVAVSLLSPQGASDAHLEVPGGLTPSPSHDVKER